MVGLGFSPLRGFESRVCSATFSLVSIFSFFVAFIGDDGCFLFILVSFVIVLGLQPKSTDSCPELRRRPLRAHRYFS